MALIATTLLAKSAPVGTFQVRRALPQRERRFVGPFCFLDHMGPFTSVATERSGVGAHPHIGLATVTYLFEGETLHRDSLGTEQRITPGDVNWMTAGRGVVHSERPPPQQWGHQTTLHGLQLWVGLPLELEETAPSFQHAPKSALPVVERDGARTRVVLGRWSGVESPIALASPTFFLSSEVERGATLPLTCEYPERALYVVDGGVEVEGQTFGPGTLLVLTPGEEGTATATADSRLAMVGGAPLEGPRFMWWNFVSSRKERLEQAKADWAEGRFQGLVGTAS